MQADGLIQGLRLDSVDDVLGERHTRFFGEGFKRVSYSLADITVVPDATGTGDATGTTGSTGAAGSPGAEGSTGQVHATVGIHLPDTWSRKGETLQRPHLSTLDGMIVAARLTGVYVAHARRLPADARFRVRGLRIKAGNAPDEEGLERFRVSARLRSTVVSPDAPGQSITTMDCTVGAMSVQVEAEHPTGEEHFAEAPTPTPRNSTGPGTPPRSGSPTMSAPSIWRTCARTPPRARPTPGSPSSTARTWRRARDPRQSICSSARSSSGRCCSTSWTT